MVDIGTWKDTHPGGAIVLRSAVGSDVTPYFLGELVSDEKNVLRV